MTIRLLVPRIVKSVAPLLSVLLAVTTGATQDKLPSPPSQVNYSVHVRPASDRTEVEITLSFEWKGSVPISVGLPKDLYGTPDLFKSITTFEGQSGTRVEPGQNPDEKSVTPGKNGRVQIRYVLAYDPVRFADVSFGPNNGPGYFHLAGCQWLLRIGDPDKTIRYRIAFQETAGWSFYSSLTKDSKKIDVQRSYDDLVTTMIGGCAGKPKILSIHGKQVILTVQGKFAIGKESIEKLVQTIIERQRAWFNDYKQEFYLVSVLPREDNIAGTCVENAFVCFIKPEATHDEFTLLISHELTHNWIGQKLNVSTPTPRDSFFTYQWLTEGLNDFIARRLMLEASMITKEKYVELFNTDILNIADNPNRATTIIDAKKAADEGRFNTAFTKLAYYRGDLIGLNWQAKIGAEQMHKFILKLLNKANQVNRSLTQAEFFEIANEYGLDAKADVEKYIQNGEPILVDPKAIAGYILEERSVPAFDPGFSLDETRRTQKISGVIKDGPAYQAGLRDGMDFVGTENSNRFGNAWKREKPLIIIVKIEGIERRFEYMPLGKPQTVQQFRKG